METVGALWLLAKINIAFQITEKVIYAGLAIFAAKTAIRYRRDYKDSIEEEGMKK